MVIKLCMSSYPRLCCRVDMGVEDTRLLRAKGVPRVASKDELVVSTPPPLRRESNKCWV